MADLKTLSDEHHVVRFVPFSLCEKDEDGNPIGFLPQAFALKVKDGELEEYLSAAWLEFFGDSDHAAALGAIKIAFKTQPSPRVGAKARFALGRVGYIRAACKKYSQTVRISHEPVQDFDSHASVRQFSSASSELLDLLASEAWSEMHLPV